jgi:hypothetical protein
MSITINANNQQRRSTIKVATQHCAVRRVGSQLTQLYDKRQMLRIQQADCLR